MLKHRNCHPSERKQGIEMSYLPFSRLYFHTCCETIVFQKTEHERNAAPSGENNCFGNKIRPLEFLILAGYILPAHCAGRVGPLCEMCVQIFLMSYTIFSKR